MTEKLYSIYLQSLRVSTDTRKIEPGSIFFALKGPNFNANMLAAEALEKGAAVAVVDEKEFAANEKCILVDDCLTALQDLAAFHRKQLKIPIIGLTGSNGKTTTKELIASVLSKKFKTLATKGNLNNHIGVPLTILSILPEHEMAIIEMGANHQGEIAALCKIAKPDYGMITNIGLAHLEGFGGFEGVIKGKSELYHHLITNNGVVWINSNNPILTNMSKRFASPLFYPNNEDYYACKLINANPFVTIESEENEVIKTNLIGGYNFENIAAALCIGKYFEVPPSERNDAIATYIPTNNRSQIIERNGNTIIMDAYNANPSSMKSALENLAAMGGNNKVVIIGDMKELGISSEEEHAKIGELLSSLDFTDVYLVGDEMKAAARKISVGNYSTSREDLRKMLEKRTFQDATILLKGSRSMGLENLLDVL